MNAGGMLQECQMGLFRGGRLNEGRCGLRGNHKIIIPPLLTFFFPTHTHTNHTQIYSQIPLEHSPLYDHQGGKFKGEFNPQLESGGYLQPLQMVLFTFFTRINVCEFEAPASCW